MSKRWPAGLILLSLVAAGCATTSGSSDEEIRIEFEMEARNLQFLDKDFQTGAELESGVCADLTGDMRFGKIPRRLAGERTTSTAHYTRFAAIYGAADEPTLIVDSNGDLRLDCAETASLVADSRAEDRFVRTVSLHWERSASSPARQRRYRIGVPGHLTESGTGAYTVEVVDVPVARWTVGEETAILVLYDGNHNGIYDRTFGDGLLIDPTGRGVFDMEPFNGENFFSYHLPLQLPWGAYEVSGLEADGSAMTFAPLEGIAARQRFEIGDSVPELACSLTDGSSLPIGGANGRHQLLFFWLSTCGSCQVDMAVLNPLIDEIGPERMTAVGISLDDRREDFDDFVTSRFIDWPQCFSGKMFWDDPVASRFGVEQPSRFVLIGPDGRLLAQGYGVDELRQALQIHDVT